MSRPTQYENLPARMRGHDWRRDGGGDAGGTIEHGSRGRHPVGAPPSDRGRQLFIKITDEDPLSGKPFQWDYTISGHAAPGGPALWTGRKARNCIEKGNTSGSASGYTITTSGDCPITGVEPAPRTPYYPAWGPYKDASDWVYQFEWPNIPIIEGSSEEGSGGLTLDGGSP